MIGKNIPKLLAEPVTTGGLSVLNANIYVQVWSFYKEHELLSQLKRSTGKMVVSGPFSFPPFPMFTPPSTPLLSVLSAFIRVSPLLLAS